MYVGYLDRQKWMDIYGYIDREKWIDIYGYIDRQKWMNLWINVGDGLLPSDG